MSWSRTSRKETDTKPSNHPMSPTTCLVGHTAAAVVTNDVACDAAFSERRERALPACTCIVLQTTLPPPRSSGLHELSAHACLFQVWRPKKYVGEDVWRMLVDFQHSRPWLHHATLRAATRFDASRHLTFYCVFEKARE